MKGFFYSFEYGDVKFIMLNTNDLYLDKLKDEQLYWLIDELKNNDCTWTVVSMHNPMFSLGYHGTNPEKNGTTLALRSQLSRIFAEYGVDIVLQGHDHVVQKTHPLNSEGVAVEENVVKEGKTEYTVDPDGVIYVMSGTAGNQLRDPQGNDKDIYDFAYRSPDVSWTEITVEGNKLTVNMKWVGTSGRVTNVKSWGIIKGSAD